MLIIGIAVILFFIETIYMPFLGGIVKPETGPESYFTKKNIVETITPESREQFFEVIPTGSTHSRNSYYYDVESGLNGWNASGLWHITDNRYYSPGHSFWYGNEETKNYDTGLANSGELISPLIDLTNTRKPFLYFNSWYQTRSDDTYDRKQALISEANGSWMELNEVSHEQKTWVRETIDLSGYAGKKIRIKFFFNTIDNNYNKYEGWYIDDIIIMEE